MGLAAAHHAVRLGDASQVHCPPAFLRVPILDVENPEQWLDLLHCGFRSSVRLDLSSAHARKASFRLLLPHSVTRYSRAISALSKRIGQEPADGRPTAGVVDRPGVASPEQTQVGPTEAIRVAAEANVRMSR
jgi:hypothetical protein